ncbi:HAMP domain protein [compost metagenome]
MGDQVHGAVVVEETTNRIASLRSQALERLLVATLVVFALAAALLLWFATSISSRIRRLSDEAEAAIDARGRVTRLTTASDAADEIGDLSRSFTMVLGRLARYNAYLEALAG